MAKKLFRFHCLTEGERLTPNDLLVEHSIFNRICRALYLETSNEILKLSDLTCDHYNQIIENITPTPEQNYALQTLDEYYSVLCDKIWSDYHTKINEVHEAFLNHKLIGYYDRNGYKDSNSCYI
jgi:hypothetical protein